MSRQPIAITGLGLVSAAGRGTRALEAALSEGRSCLRPLAPAVAAGLAMTRGATIPDAALAPLAEGNGTRPPERVQRASRLAIEEALAHARLPAAGVGLALGTALGPLERLQAHLDWRGTEPDATDALECAAPHRMSRELARALGLTGPVSTFSATCVSALYALEQAAIELETGPAEAVVCGGVDGLSRFMQAGFCALGALERHARPPAPVGEFCLGEAACFAVFETLEHARRRAAPVFGILAGRSIRSDGGHLTTPDESGGAMIDSVHAALAEGGCKPQDVACVSLTATASPAYQAMYHNVLHEVFGAARTRLSISNWEPCVGHVLAASGMLGIVSAALHLTAATAAPARGEVLALTVGFGGQNGATLIAAAPGSPSAPKLTRGTA